MKLPKLTKQYIGHDKSNLTVEQIDEIVRRCNNHDALLDELVKSTALLEAVHENIELSKNAKLSIHNKIIENKAAIALAENQA